MPTRPSLTRVLTAAALAGVAALCPSAITAQSRSAPAFDVPEWAFPLQVPPPAPNYGTLDSVTLHRIAGSPRAFTLKQALTTSAPVDWFPGAHPAPPLAVRRGASADRYGCAFCHLYSGSGRPENATIAGLSVNYQMAQIAAFRDSSRHFADARRPFGLMHGVVHDWPDDSLRAAVAYFAALRHRRPNRVIESDSVPTHRVAVNLFVRSGNGREVLAGRLIEMPESRERHELHDPTVRYTTWVPRGSLATGRQLATRGPAGAATACTTCHGPQLRGVGDVPPLAGRSPSNLLRQLINFRTGARRGGNAALMMPVVQSLTLAEMVAVAG
jgi:cytochrome c553